MNNTFMMKMERFFLKMPQQAHNKRTGVYKTLSFVACHETCRDKSRASRQKSPVRGTLAAHCRQKEGMLY